MRMYDIIQKKRNGGELSEEEIAFFVKGYTNGEIPDYQAAALCMAIYFRKMTDRETAVLTEQMAVSGDKIDLSKFAGLTVDKHSTGGVGDKTTLIVAPIVASLGGIIVKMSGRGLGHTGGTVDKLESIDGYKTSLPIEELMANVEKTRMAVVAQTANLAPADKKLYALRDVIATVDNISLITSSIMSKKIAAGSKNIVLDVKVGSGSFMKTLDDARLLAEKMVSIGKSCGRNTVAVLTDMNCPLGNNIGNSLEVIEAVGVLKGEIKGDLLEVSTVLATQMLCLALNISKEKAEKMVKEAIFDKSAFNKMKEWVSSQGGNAEMLDDTSLFRKAKYSKEVISRQSGYITKMDAEKIGSTAVILGAGREAKGESINHSAGIILNKKLCHYVEKGELLCTLYSDNKQLFENAEEMYLSAITLGKQKPQRTPLIYEIIK